MNEVCVFSVGMEVWRLDHFIALGKLKNLVVNLLQFFLNCIIKRNTHLYIYSNQHYCVLILLIVLVYVTNLKKELNYAKLNNVDN